MLLLLLPVSTFTTTLLLLLPLLGSSWRGVEGSLEPGREAAGEPRNAPATGVTVITLGQPEVWPEEEEEVGSTDLATSSSTGPLLCFTSAGCSSSLSLMVMTSSGRDWPPLPLGLSQLTGLEWLEE